jgi:hypothetical protein
MQVNLSLFLTIRTADPWLVVGLFYRATISARVSTLLSQHPLQEESLLVLGMKTSPKKKIDPKETFFGVCTEAWRSSFKALSSGRFLSLLLQLLSLNSCLRVIFHMLMTITIG